MKRLNAQKIAKILGMTMAGVYKAMQDGRLKHYQDGKFKWCSDEQVAEFNRKKHYKKRSFFARYNGMPISDPQKGTYNVHEAAIYLQLKPSRIYYLVKQKRLKSIRKGCYHVFKKEEMDRFLNNTLENCEFLRKIV